MRQMTITVKRQTSFLIVILSACLILAIALPVMANEGRIVGILDDWVLTNLGFQGGHDADVFVVNIAQWFTGGPPGSFVSYGNTFHLNGDSLMNALNDAGHSYVVSDSLTFSVGELQAYDGVFIGAWPLGEDPQNTAALVDYVQSGGNVYIFGGTNFYGSIAADAVVLNGFMNQFGLQFASQMTSYKGSFNITGSHVILDGVQYLYCDNGTVLSDLAPNNPENAIIEPTLGGAIAVFDGHILEPIPTLSSWGAVLVTLLLASAGIIVIRRGRSSRAI